VLYLAHTTARGGAAGSLYHLIRHFPPGSVEATILCPEGPMVSAFREVASLRVIPGVSMFHSLAGAPLRRLRLLELLRTAWFMRSAGAIRDAIAETRPDLVHLNERGMLHAAWIAHGAGVPVVMHARSVADRSTAWVRRVSTALTVRYVNRVVAIDQSVRHSLREIPDVEVIYNPLDAGWIPARAVGWGPGGDGIVRVTYLTGLLPFKGIWDLLEAARLLRHRADIQFLIAGSNSRPAEFHRSIQGKLAHLFGFAPDVEAAVHQWVARERLGSTVSLAGHVRDTRDLLQRTDILAFPSHLNGPGRSVFEAGVLGVPAVVALQDRIEDVVVDGETGLIVPERDPESLARAIVRLADDPALRQRLGEMARSRYAAQFEASEAARRILAIYRNLTARTAGAAARLPVAAAPAS
jgi:glycosyltransferase involved in cell wall biosynthesis